AGSAGEGALTPTNPMLVLGAGGNPAQIPLQAADGDAVPGPAPGSALVHAATLRTAGGYLLGRSGPGHDGAPTAQPVGVIIGRARRWVGWSVGCGKGGRKQARAASTRRQIGYMLLAAGLGPIGYAFAIFHPLTRGFCKAGLFLGAGSVMHAMKDEIDMRGF